MKFTVKGTDFRDRLTRAGRVIGTRNAIPLLGCYHIAIKDGKMTVTGSDNDTYYTTGLTLVECDGEATFCVPASTIAKSMEQLPEQPVTFEYDASRHSLRGKHSTGHFVASTYDAAGYPCPVPLDNPTILTLPERLMAQSVKRCVGATANEEIRLCMTGVYVDIDDMGVTFVGTNGKVLVKDRLLLQGCTEGHVILPKKVSTLIASMKSKDEPDLTLAFDANGGEITGTDYKIQFRTVEANYPNYNAVIPTNLTNRAVVSTEGLVSSLKRIAVFINRTTGLIRCRYDFGTLRLSGQDLDFNTSAEENIPCEYSGAPMEIGYNADMLLFLVENISGDTVALTTTTPDRPSLVLPAASEDNEELTMLLMPMMLA